MGFDFGVLILLIFLVLFTVVGIASNQGIYNILTIPLIVYFIIVVQELDNPALPTVALSAFALINAFLAVISYINKED